MITWATVNISSLSRPLLRWPSSAIRDSLKQAMKDKSPPGKNQRILEIPLEHSLKCQNKENLQFWVYNTPRLPIWDPSGSNRKSRSLRVRETWYQILASLTRVCDLISLILRFLYFLPRRPIGSIKLGHFLKTFSI